MKPGTVQFTSTTYHIVLWLYHSIVGFTEQIIWYTIYRSTISAHLHFYRCMALRPLCLWMLMLMTLLLWRILFTIPPIPPAPLAHPPLRIILVPPLLLPWRTWKQNGVLLLAREDWQWSGDNRRDAKRGNQAAVYNHPR